MIMASKAKFRVFDNNSFPHQPYAWKNPNPQYRNPENRRTSVCAYLKNKIASEEKEAEEYQRLAEDAGELDAGKFGYIPFLKDVQREELRLLKETYKRICGEPKETTGKYAIYYYKGTDYFPASGTYIPQDTFNSREEAISVARKLSEKYHGVVFGVYPVNHNFEISGKAVASYGSL